MKVIEASWEITQAPAAAAETVERIARDCYQSEGRIGPWTAGPFIRHLRGLTHTAMFEHVSATVRFIVDRGVSHEIVRHRIASYAQSSTRYVDYAKHGLEFVRPCFWLPDLPAYADWAAEMARCEAAYLRMRGEGARPEQARSVLPNSLACRLNMTANFRSWRNVFTLRCAKAAHPQMRQVMVPLRDEFIRRWPEFFDDLA